MLQVRQPYGDAPSPQRVGFEQPGNVYGFSKLAMDNLAREFCKQNPAMRVIGLRYFNVWSKEVF